MDSLQSVYASCLPNDFGYPLWFPEPSTMLPSSYGQDGLQIGDVGYISCDGAFQVLLNISFDRNHALHQQPGLPPFSPIHIDHEVDIRKGALSAGRIITSPDITQSSPPQRDGHYEFTTSSNKGAILILPDGATSYDLLINKRFRDIAAMHAHEWYRFAKQKYGEDISTISLYLITGFYKARSWLLASFHDTAHTTQHRVMKVVPREFEDTTTRWWGSSHMNFRDGPRPGQNEKANQTVFIRGFKIAVKDDMFDWFLPETRIQWVPTALLRRGHYGCTRLLVVLCDKDDPSLWGDGENDVAVADHVPALSQPFHPSNLINLYLLNKDLSAFVAITHDSEWIMMMKMGKITLDELTQTDRLEEFLSENYTLVSHKHKYVHLRCNSISHPMPTINNFQNILTCIQVEDIAGGLNRMPIGFYFMIRFDGTKKRTESKPVDLDDRMLQWNTWIELPTELSTVVWFSFCASFEHSPRLGNGETICEVDVRVGDLLKGGYMITFSEEDATLPFSSLLIKAEKQWDLDQPRIALDYGSDVVLEDVAWLTDRGHVALLRYQGDPRNEHIAASIKYFEHALTLSPSGNQYHAAALCNLAFAHFSQCRTGGIWASASISISCYREALRLRQAPHPDRPATLLHLARALLLHYEMQDFKESTADEIMALATEVQSTCAVRSHERRAADLILETCILYKAVAFGNLADVCDLIPSLHQATQDAPRSYFDMPQRLTNLGLALQSRYQLHGNLNDLNESIRIYTEAIQMTQLPYSRDCSFSTALLLKEWVKLKLMAGSWKDTLIDGISNFTLPRFVICQTICKYLVSIHRLIDAVECVNSGIDWLEVTDARRSDWILDFISRCYRRLEVLGDASLKNSRYDEAISQYTAVISLNPTEPQGLFFKRSKASAAKGLWDDALSDANEIIKIDPSSPLGYERQHAALCGLGRCAEAAFETMLLKMSQSLDSKIHEHSLRYVLEQTTYDIHTSIESMIHDHPIEFRLSRYTVYRAVCNVLEGGGRITEAVGYFRQIQNESTPDVSANDDSESVQWKLGFKSRCCGKLEELGDNAMGAKEYDEAISHYTTALSLHPVMQNVLIKRSKAHAGRGRWKDALNDANEVISLDPSSPWGYERKHEALRGSGNYGDAINAFETMLSMISESSDPRIRERAHYYVRPEETREAIRTTIRDAIRDSPLVLINAASGRLYSKSEQAAAFESTPVFTELVSSMTTHIDYARINQAVEEFYSYAMFSHRWEADEPVYENVIKILVYDLKDFPTHNKLQMFCKIIRKAGFHWAWSDTCCIDKKDPSVLQEALVSMFKWYEGSALTIVFLLGVPHLAKRGALAKSIWNTRGWTLQEYHASKVVRFYTEDWTPYLGLDIYNHKESPEIILEMEEATGISVQALMALRPGLEDIREKLRLASTRQTTRVEDAAYSLLGIFSVSLPVIYGEGDKALGQLLAQVLTASGDTSILAWTGRSGTFNTCLPADIAVFSQPPSSHIPSAITNETMNTGLGSIDLPLATGLYDQLHGLPSPFFVGRRLKLPCLSFKLGQVSLYNRSERVFRARTHALGVVEIRTEEDLGTLDTFYLIHPWIDFLLDRHSVGCAAGTINDAEPSMIDESLPLPDPPNTTPRTWNARATKMLSRLSLQFRGRHTRFSRDNASPDSLLPPSTVSPEEKKMRVAQFVTRLRQPFGALLLMQTRRNTKEYRRVASESLIEVRVEEITPAILERLIMDVQVFDVL